tara:strand:- start:359 stop:538 length:180 start_codon:yes stop_codon:yes gene_type:complete
MTDFRVALQLTSSRSDFAWETTFVVAADTEENAVGEALARAVRETTALSSAKVVSVRVW